MWAELGFILGAYLVGSIPQVYYLGRLRGKDLRREGDLHLALWRTSRGLGLLGILADLAKGPLPVVAGRLWGLETWTVAVGGLAVVGGQMWPALMPSAGGRGNSTGLSMALVLTPLATLVAIIPILASLVVRSYARRSLTGGPQSRSLPLGMLVGFALLPLASLPLASWWHGEPEAITLVLAGLFLAIVLRRLTVGLRQDLRLANSKGSLFLNRLLYDRSFV